MFKILLLVSVFSVSSVVCAKHSLRKFYMKCIISITTYLLNVRMCGIKYSIILFAAPYLEKCSMSDPNLSQCYVDHGNKAIPIVSKGNIHTYPTDVHC